MALVELILLIVGDGGVLDFVFLWAIHDKMVDE
jgi:hypothetical protein